MQSSLFNEDPYLDAQKDISGLQYLPDFINRDSANELLQAVDNEEWLPDLKRRVQHYGYKYDYKRRNIDRSMHLGDLPTWSRPLAEEFVKQGIMPVLPDQLIVNEYQPGQGIANHVDCEPCFADHIVSLSLGSAYCMNFTQLAEPKAVHSLRLMSGSLVVLSGAARYDWMHGIKALKNDNWNGQRIPRTRRVSLTFRKTILNP